MRRDFGIAAAAWIALTVVLEYAALTFNYFPVGIAKEAEIIDEAFDLLAVLGIPVFTFVVVGLVYAILRFRAADDSEDGPPIFTHKPLTWSWFVITSGLAIYVIINPGITGLNKLLADQEQDLVIRATASQWQWDYDYQGQGVSIVGADELVLPVDQRVKFEVTSTDVIHSFWVPAFRMKIDAVPGQINELYVTPTETGSTEDDGVIRVQCAELCGTGHPRMRTNLRVVSQEDFQDWLEANQ